MCIGLEKDIMSLHVLLWNYVTRFFTALYSRVIRRLKGSNGKEIERRKEVEVVGGADLPLELWEAIGKHLVRSTDVICFRSLCKQSRLALPSPTLLPIRVPPPPNSDNNGPYFITKVNFYSVDSKTGQRVLMAFQQEHEHGKVRPCVIVPLGDEYFYMMLASSNLNHLHPRLTFVAKAYRLGTTLPPTTSYEANWDFQYRRLSKLAEKMVLISSNADGSCARASDLSVVVLLRTQKLALLRLERPVGKNWEWNTSFCNDIFLDIVAYKGQLCTIDYDGSCFLMDSNSLKMTKVAPPPVHKYYSLMPMSLFEACGEVHLSVDQSEGLQKTQVEAKVYKLSLRLGKWVKVEGLGNQAFVLCAGFNVPIPRDAFSVNYRTMKNGTARCNMSPSLLFSYDHDDKDASNNHGNYCFIHFSTRHYPNTMASYFHEDINGRH